MHQWDRNDIKGLLSEEGVDDNTIVNEFLEYGHGVGVKATTLKTMDSILNNGEVLDKKIIWSPFLREVIGGSY